MAVRKRNKERRAASERGVTLVETLVALLIMGMVAGAVLALVAQNTRFAAAARDRTYAAIAADNLMVRELVREGPVQIGERTGSTEIAGRALEYRVTITESGIEDLFRVDVDVLNRGQVAASAVTLRRAP